MLKHPQKTKTEVFDEVTVGNGEHFDIYTVNRVNKENTGYVKVYVSNSGKVRVYINQDDEIEVLRWKGQHQFRQDVEKDYD